MTVFFKPMSCAKFAFTLAACLLLSACADEHMAARTPEPQHAPQSFAMAASVSDKDLSVTRGGFITSGGLNIEFGLSTTTLVNGTIQSSLNLSSAGLNGAIPTNLQQLIQAGTTAQFTNSTINNGVLTLVQNNVNDQVIQNTNVLNLTVSNIAVFHNQLNLNSSMFSAIRALH